MATTFGVIKRDLIASVGELIHSGTTTSASGTNTLIDTGLNYPADTLNQQWLYVYEGTGKGQERRIIDSTQAGTLTIERNWGTEPASGDKYYVYQRRFNNAAYEAVWKQALRLLRPFFLIPDEDVASALGDPTLAATYAVTVPTGMVAIHRIIREDATLDGVYTVPFPGPCETSAPWWNISLDGTTYKIVLDYEVQQSLGSNFIMEGRDLKIIGQKRETEPTADDSSITINPGPVTELAALLLTARLLPTVEERANATYIFTNRMVNFFANLGTGVWPGSVLVEQS